MANVDAIGFSSLNRKFITPRRALNEFMLRPSHLDDLPVFYRRSPYYSGANIMVYNRADVARRALDVWGSIDAFISTRSNRASDLSAHKKSKLVGNSKNQRKDNRAGNTHEVAFHQRSWKLDKRDYIVILAVVVDCLNFSFKLVAYLITKSDSIFAEVIHSAADTLNQGLLLIGVFKSQQAASAEHPYGYSSVVYVSSLISGVAIFCMGGAINFYNGLTTMTSSHLATSFEHIYWAFAGLTFSFVTEIVPLVLSILSTCETASQYEISCLSFGQDPKINVILLEDSVAVLGTIIAGAMLYWSWDSESYYPDAAGSMIIGIMLGIVAMILIYSSSKALMGRSIDPEKLEAINRYLESDVMIRGIYDVKGIDLGENKVRYKGEIDFDGAELTSLYLDHIDRNAVFTEIQNMRSPDDVREFLIKHGERIVDLLGREVDRIEGDLRRAFPEIRHVDLEVL